MRCKQTASFSKIRMRQRHPKWMMVRWYDKIAPMSVRENVTVTVKKYTHPAYF